MTEGIMALQNVININDYKDHVTITCSDSVHVIPVDLFENISNYKTKITDLEDFDIIIPRIIGEWLNFLYKKQEE